MRVTSNLADEHEFDARMSAVIVAITAALGELV